MDTDPFEQLGLERTFSLSPRRIRDAWRSLAVASHPDVAGTDDNTHEVTRDAASLNDAMHTLKDPERRADTLVVLLGGPTREQDTSLPPEFLGQMMEVRESFEEAVRSQDTPGICRWTDWANQQRDDLLGAIGELFESHDQSPDEQALAQIRQALNKLRFIERMREQLTQPDS
ncbi:MAG: Fe-S protein assembly co-chaperone HscB [Planctomycetota bacterium]